MSRIGFIGGTGDLGMALAVHLAKEHEEVLIGSRNKEKAESTIRDILRDKGEPRNLKSHLISATNDFVVSSCENVILTVPYEAAIETIKGLSDRFNENHLLISTVATIQKSGRQFVPVTNVGSISKVIQGLLPKSVGVASAFQTIPAGILYREEKINADVLVACDEKSIFQQTAEIVSSIEGLRPLYAGSLEVSGVIEGLTALLLNVAANEHLKSPTLKVHSF